MLDARIDDPLVNKIEKKKRAGEANEHRYKCELYREMKREKDVEEKKQDADQQ
jgi:hypothetical protein